MASFANTNVSTSSTTTTTTTNEEINNHDNNTTMIENLNINEEGDNNNDNMTSSSLPAALNETVIVDISSKDTTATKITKEELSLLPWMSGVFAEVQMSRNL